MAPFANTCLKYGPLRVSILGPFLAPFWIDFEVDFEVRFEVRLGSVLSVQDQFSYIFQLFFNNFEIVKKQLEFLSKFDLGNSNSGVIF